MAREKVKPGKAGRMKAAALLARGPCDSCMKTVIQALAVMGVMFQLRVFSTTSSIFRISSFVQAPSTYTRNNVFYED